MTRLRPGDSWRDRFGVAAAVGVVALVAYGLSTTTATGAYLD